jgi:hypothetical protein
MRRLVLAIAACVCAVPLAGDAQAPPRGVLPTAISDGEFWRMFTTLSEPSGTFSSENFVSNEISFLLPIRTLQRTTRPGGVYMGVGPEQNYTYIANLRPAMAIIVDIRRQNALLHLMYKALFEMSPTRAAFVGHLFARPLPARFDTQSSVERLFDEASVTGLNRSVAARTADSIVLILTRRHGFALGASDQATIRRVYEVFYTAGPRVNYSWRSNNGARGSTRYVTYATLQTATDPDGAPLAFLGSEASYRRIRALHAANLIVPIVGDFAGPKALRLVGQWIREHGGTVQAFYLSNVEQYLFRSRGYPERFYASVATLPLDSTSTFIRSVPPGTGNVGRMGARTVTVTPQGGAARTSPTAPPRADRARQAVPISGGRPIPSSYNVLVSGISSILTTVRAFDAGAIGSYSDLARHTTLTGW